MRADRKKKSRSKEIHRERLVEYLSNPDIEVFPPRSEYTKLLGLKSSYRYLYKIFSPEDLTMIEGEALALRRGMYARDLMKVDRALLRNAAENGKAPEVALAYKRFEGWQEKSSTEVTHTLKLDKELQELLNPVYKRGAIIVEPEREAQLLPAVI
jgi:hypothetical protein